jgi:sulfhydrogenase subunit delta
MRRDLPGLSGLSSWPLRLFRPVERPQTAALAAEWQRLGASRRDIHLAFRSFKAAAEPFRQESDTHGD